MKLQVLPYVSIDIDDRLRRRLRSAGDRFRVQIRAYLRSAADDVDEASDRVRGLCDRAVTRVDTVVASVNDKIAPTPQPTPQAPPRLRVVGGREAS